ncbi:MAG: roadblock/LC7 domain-containing protein [Planctomycetes bacterium]|jgi:predicted regulator of Ras-like GTPase activity (Roadblock/LC7/MglB family)|nr:roadblock/LC7 domain-containing protein [Planctomycetota bacterium]HNZ66034.1 roadblock/LC7 domain-containing protein [Planctomycetota bacterium]HPY74326.1 roadblock/LC7 domain-containing protein [Planctomycetota bacterium]HQA99908.1 roadblock/LC7 domain-containing protein [Planctomycetota bacterium]HRU51693.1 roadblock/LC7 domain-containing protein [Planctomycetota bacterium]
MKDDEKLKLQRLIFYKEDIQLIDKVLQVFLKRSQAKCAILIDKEGHLITTHGENQSYDLDTICTLLASTFAATREWAKLLGEEEFSVLFHQGKKDSIQVTLIRDRTLLAVIFDDRTQLGLVRLVSSEVAKKLENIFQQAENRRGEHVLMDAEFETDGFSDSANKLLDELFGDED